MAAGAPRRFGDGNSGLITAPVDIFSSVLRVRG
jgi:hypothetical protein